MGMTGSLAHYGAVAIASVFTTFGTGPTTGFAADTLKTAQAAEAVSAPDSSGTLTILEGDAVTTVIERFAVAPDKQDDALAKVKAGTAGWTNDEKFVGYVLLRSRETAGGVAIYSQWSRQKDEVVAEKPEVARSLRSALKDYELIDSDNFSVAFTAQAPALKAPSEASLSTTPLAHFGLFRIDPANYEELIRRVKTYAPNSFSVKGLRAINFHRAASGRFVVNFGLWDSFDNFAELQKAPGFAQREQYYVGLADFRPDFFDVVAVVSNRKATSRQRP